MLEITPCLTRLSLTRSQPCEGTSNVFYKTIALVIAGNILEFYDFLLFAHLGIIITPLFFPQLDQQSHHLLVLLLFGVPFIMRPLGGYVLGRIADKKGRAVALTTSILWATLPPLLIAVLPNYAVIGIVASLSFIFLRLFQGFAIGGEYPSAGVYLMEITKMHAGLVSSLLVASGMIGSLLGWRVAALCLSTTAPQSYWRLAFLLGALFGILSYKLRQALVETLPTRTQVIHAQHHMPSDVLQQKRLLTILIGLFVGMTVWLPMTYVNFYVTKILHLPIATGLDTTLIALSTFILLTPLFGYLSDRMGHRRLMLIATLYAGPLSFMCIYALSIQAFYIAQIGLVIIAASFNAPIHVVMSQLYPQAIRVRNVAIFFAIGLSVGGLTPFSLGYLVQTTGYIYYPALLISGFACLTGYGLWRDSHLPQYHGTTLLSSSPP